MRARPLAALLVAIVLVGRPAAAQPHPRDPTAAQQDLYDRAFEAFGAGDFSAAVEKLRAALALGSLNMLELGLGRALQRLGDCEGARAAFDRALSAPPVREPAPHEVIQRVERYRAELEAACVTPPPARTEPSEAGHDRGAPQAAVPPRARRTTAAVTAARHAPAPSRGAAQRTWAWIVGGTGLGVLGATIAGDVVVLGAAVDDYRAAMRVGASDADDRRSHARNLQTLIGAGYLTGGVLVAASAALLLTAPSSDQPSAASTPSAAAWASPAGAFVAVAGRF